MKRPRLVISLLGGLGNQLFQFACAYALARHEDRELVLDASSFGRQRLRAYRLDRFRVPARLAEPGELSAWGLEAGLWARLRRRLMGPRIATVAEQGFAYQALRLPHGEDCRLTGYWQSERYFEAQAPALRRALAWRAPARGINAAWLRRIRAAGPKAAAVHVRRGDYVSQARVAAVHGSLGLDYYAAALKRLRAAVKGARLFVFSDEPAWVRAQALFRGAVVLDSNPPELPEEDLRLMAACRHFVIANSSFSWWGAWLGEARGTRVLAPRRWFADAGRDSRDLLPKRWARLG